MATNSIIGTEGNDTLTGTSGDDTINAFAGSDSITGLEGNDQIYITDNGSTDTIDGGGGWDGLNLRLNTSAYTIAGGNIRSIEGYAIDLWDVNRATAPEVTLSDAAFTNSDWIGVMLMGPVAATLNASSVTAGHNVKLWGDLWGGGTMIGGAGDDQFWAFEGNDSLVGGAGMDTWYYNFGQTELLGLTLSKSADSSWTVNSGSAAVMKLQTNTTTGTWTVTDLRTSPANNSRAFGVDSLNGIEVLSLGVEANGGWTTAGTLALGGTLASPTVTLSGVFTPGDDTVLGTPGNDRLEGGAGNDLLLGDGGSDNLIGGSGDDTLNGGVQMGLSWRFGKVNNMNDWDEADYSGTSTGGVSLNLSNMTVTGLAGANTGTDTLRSIEAVTMTRGHDEVVGNFAKLAGNNELAGDVHEMGIVGNGGSDSFSQALGTSMPWQDVWIGYWWSRTAINVTLSGSTGTVSYGAAGTAGSADYQAAGVDTLSRINCFTDTVYSDTFNFKDQTETATVGHKWAWVGLGLGNDTVIGNGETFVSFNNGGLQSSTGKGIFVQLGAPGSTTTVNMTHLRKNGTALGIASLTGVNAIRGAGLDDTLMGGSSNEHFEGCGGNDLIDGGAGSDRARYLYNSTTGITVNMQAGTVDGRDSMDASVGQDTLRSIEMVQGTNLDDIYDARGFSGTSTNAGSRGAWNQFAGNGGSDTIYGNGNTSIAYDFSSVAVDVNLATGQAQALDPANRVGELAQIVGTDTFSGVNAVWGSVLGDKLTGDSGANVLEGSDGDDTMNGGAGGDSLDGGAGHDTLDYSQDVGAVTVNLQTARATDGSGGQDTVVGFEEVRGSAFNDSITGSSNLYREVFAGGLGNDTIDGGEITDTLNMTNSNTVSYQGASGAVSVTLSLTQSVATGADGTDVLININTVYGSGFNDSITGSARTDVFEQFKGGAGNDTIDGGGGNYDMANFSDATGGVTVTLTGGGNGTATGAGIGTDTLKSIQGIIGSGFADLMTGSASTGNTLAFVEIFRGEAGNDTINGGAGLDFAFYDTSTAGVVVTLGGSADGTAQDGLGGTDVLRNIEGVRGSDLGDTLTGSGWGEVFQGRAGNDVIDGQGGVDNAFYLNSVAGINVDLSQNKAFNDGYGSSDVLLNMENVTGSRDFTDSITGNNGDNFLEGNGGNDTLLGGAGQDFLIGGTGDDFIDGGTNDMVLGRDWAGYEAASGAVQVNLATWRATGADGNDTLTGIEGVAGSAFADTLTGDANSNVLRGNGGDDTIDGGAGFDSADYKGATGSVTVSLVTNTASGFDGNDTLINIEAIRGGKGNDTLTGDANNNSIRGNGGNDLMDGGGGVDTADYYEATGGVTVNLTTGRSSGADGNDTLTGFERSRGSFLYADSLTGNDGDNSIEGVGGNDTINGGAGSDSLDGGTGNDVLDYSQDSGAVTVNLQTQRATDGSGGQDTVVGFEEVRGSAFNDSITGSSNLYREVFVGGLGNDTIDGGAITDTLNLTNANAVSYQGASGAVSVSLSLTQSVATGADGTDVLINISAVYGSGFSDTISGSARTDIFERFRGGAGNDTIDGGGGYYDFADFSDATGGVTVTLTGGGNGTATGAGIGTDTLKSIQGIMGSDFADSITGSASTGNALLTTELFRAGAGNDTIDGGAGNDWATYDTSTAGVVVTLGGSADGTAQDGLGGTDVLRNIEGVMGSDLGDTLTGSSGSETFQGRAGNDVIDGQGGIDTAYYSSSVAGINVDLSQNKASNDGYGSSDMLLNIENVFGSRDFNDSITGNSGNNRLEGIGGNDTLVGGEGNDSVLGGTGDDFMEGGAGTDNLAGGAGNDTAAYQFGQASLAGLALTSTGTATWTLASAGGALLTLQANTSTGAWTVTDARTAIPSGSSAFGIDTLSTTEMLALSTQDSTGTVYRAANIYLGGTLAAPTLELRDVAIFGTESHDYLTGTSGNDTIYGLPGGDYLIGGAGDDTLNGGVQLNMSWRFGKANNTDDWDMADYSGTEGGGVSLNLSNMKVTGLAGAKTGTDTLRGIEEVTMTRQHDELVGTLAALAGTNETAGDQHEVGLYGLGGSDSFSEDLHTNTPWQDIYLGYGWSKTAITVKLTGSTGTVTYGSVGTPGAADYQAAGVDTLSRISEFMGTSFSDTFDFKDQTENAVVGQKWAWVDLNTLGNDTVIGNGETSVSFGAGSTPISSTGKGIYVQLGERGITTTVDRTHLGQNGNVRGIATLTDVNGVTGTGLDDTLIGSSGNEHLSGGRGNDLIDGGTGYDAAGYLWGSTTGITVNMQTGTVDGRDPTDTTVGHDTLRSIEIVKGTNLNDIYDARGFSGTSTNAGSDGQWNKFQGNGGDDTIYGNGATSIAYDFSSVAVDVNLSTGQAQALDPANRVGELAQIVGNDTFTGVYDVVGSALGDKLTGGGAGRVEGASSYEVFRPGAGNDTVDGQGGWVAVAYNDATSGITVDLSLASDQVQDGMGGTDTLVSIEGVFGSTFDDVLLGSDSNSNPFNTETFAGGMGNDTIDGGGGYDSVFYGYGNPSSGVNVNLATGLAQDGFGTEDTLLNIEGISGSELDDTLTGNAGDNRLEGRGGNDTIDGGAGNDWARYENTTAGAVQVNLATGLATGGAGNDTLLNIENVLGSVFDDTLTGNAGANRLQGGAGNDTLNGGGGMTNDTAAYTATKANYTVTRSAGVWTVKDNAGDEGTDTLTGIEFIAFADQTIDANHASTGVVKISGVAKQNKTLTASNTLADADGMGTVSYQWSADGVAISGASSATLQLGQAHVGKVIAVTAWYTDALGTAESVASNNTAPVLNVNDLSTGAVSVVGALQQGQTLTASNNLADADGMGTVSYQWFSAETGAIAGANAASLTLGQAQVGQHVYVKASYTDGGGKLESKVSATKDAVSNVNDAPTGSVLIDGNTWEGQTLTARSAIGDADGLGAFQYQWLADGQVIDDADASTLLLTSNLVGRSISVQLAYLDGGDTEESVTSAPTDEITPRNTAAIGNVQMAGSAAQYQVLQAQVNLQDDDGLGAFSFKWYATDANGQKTAIANATSETLTLQQAQVGKRISANTSYTDGHGNLESVDSALSSAVANVNDRSTGVVSITGTAKQGSALKASNTLADLDGLGTVSYQWKANGTAIAAATTDTLTLTQAQVGAKITVTASYVDDFGAAESKTSMSSKAVVKSNVAPVINSLSAANFSENATGIAYTIAATDQDAATVLNYSLSGADATLFNVNASTGVVTFKSAPNFEAPADAGANNVYDVTVAASDGKLIATKAVAITVSNVNEAPTIGSPATATFAEMATGTAYAAAATDPDAGTTLNYTIGGADAALFKINASTGAVSFKAAPNYEAPADAGADNLYEISVSASDGALSTSKSVSISVKDVLEIGQSVIDLGSYGKLIAPVQVDKGNWYYFWDMSGNGVAGSTGGTLNGGLDTTTHNVIDGLFNKDINGIVNNSVKNFDGNFGTTDTYRYATLNGVKLALPTMGGTSTSGQQLGTAVGNATAANGSNAVNAKYNDLLAVWDAYNGTATGSKLSGTPANWQADNYWSATDATGVGHGTVNLSSGNLTSAGDNNLYFVALQVLG